MNYNILIAEYDTDITELLSLYLGSDGYHIHTAQTGLQALDIIASEKIDCAVIDIMMPEMNGYDLLQKIRETNNFPVIILSARNLDSDKILGLNLGADAYLTKHSADVMTLPQILLHQSLSLSPANSSLKTCD